MFARVMTQWRAGPAGIIGLDYGVVLQILALYSCGDLVETLEDLQIMEAHALERFSTSQEA